MAGKRKVDDDIVDIKLILTNHMHDYSTKFGRLKATFDLQAEVYKVRDKALHQKIDGYRWVLVLVTSLTVVALGGFIYVAVWLIQRLGG